MKQHLAQVFHFSTEHITRCSYLGVLRTKQKQFLRYLTANCENLRLRAPGRRRFRAGPVWILLGLLGPVSPALAADTPKMKPVSEARIHSVSSAIAVMEGWNASGSLVRRYNNPGGLKRGARYLQFRTAAEGWTQLHKLVRFYLERGLELGQLIDRWTPDPTGRTRYRQYFHQLGLL